MVLIIQLFAGGVERPIPQEVDSDVLRVPQPERDVRRGGAAVQLAVDAQEAHAQRRLCRGAGQHRSQPHRRRPPAPRLPHLLSGTCTPCLSLILLVSFSCARAGLGVHICVRYGDRASRCIPYYGREWRRCQLVCTPADKAGMYLPNPRTQHTQSWTAVSSSNMDVVLRGKST